uniref:Fatty acid hydroxylase domain-containing protein 2 isoform X3 n=1 Tax=Camelus bactrianus TaxID=9837 RepID=A0A9W3FLF7_CAMBA|nr:fatty acid hydroxylase domain-containing protein 2 isoform X3 [Camelus bactrianus]
MKGEAGSTLHSEKPKQEGHLWGSMRRTAFILGSGLLLLVALWNSVTWHIQRFWGASGCFWQAQWERLLSTCEGQEWILYILGAIQVPFLVYWSFSGLFLVVDTTGKPNFISRYRIQVGKNEPTSSSGLHLHCSTRIVLGKVTRDPVAGLSHYTYQDCFHKCSTPTLVKASYTDFQGPSLSSHLTVHSFKSPFRFLLNLLRPLLYPHPLIYFFKCHDFKYHLNAHSSSPELLPESQAQISRCLFDGCPVDISHPMCPEENFCPPTCQSLCYPQLPQSELGSHSGQKPWSHP